MLEIPVSPKSIYDSDDRSFLLWLSVLTERVMATRKEQHDRIKRGR